MNSPIPATLGTEIIGLIIEVATFQGLIYYTRVCNWDKEHVAVQYREVATIQRLGIMEC